MKSLARFILKITGWKTDFNYKVEDKCVIIAAPHTSMWDFVLALLFMKSIGGSAKFMIKKEMFFFPLGIILKFLGGLPVDRSFGNKMVEKVASKFKEYDKLQLAITPEGTRKLVHNWKRGFYYIAKRAGVPIYIGFVDYKKKELGIMTRFIPTDDISSDMQSIQSMFIGITAKHPEKFSAGKNPNN